MPAPLKKHTKILTLSLWLLLLLIFSWSLTLGPGKVSFAQVIEVLSARLGALSFIDNTTRDDTTRDNTTRDATTRDDTISSLVWQIRLPRALLAMLIGAALGCAGALTQGIFRNPLAAPNILGLSSGAALMVIVGIALGLDEAALWSTPLLAVTGVLAAFFLLYLLGRSMSGLTSLLLCGVALSAFFGALITLLLSLFIADHTLNVKMSQWLLGSLETRSWLHLLWGLIPIGLGLLASLYLRKDLDVLHLGPETAQTLGLHLRLVYLSTIACVALLVGAATALVGIIGFVGLLVPHLARLLIGGSYSRIVPLCISLGAAVMLCVDLLSRTLLAVYLPPGVITSLAGTPLFIWLIRRSYQK